MMSRVLMYHGLESSSQPTEVVDPGELVYVLHQRDFLAQLDWLAASEWTIAAPSATGESKAALLTFDDGHVSNHEVALPLLLERSLKACFFITTDWIGQDHYMTESMIRALADNGMEIGSHGASHRFLTDLSAVDAEVELRSSKERLEEILGRPVSLFSAPGGRIDRDIGTLAGSLGYRGIYVSDSTPKFSVPGVDVVGRLALKRSYSIEQFETLMRSGREPESVLLRRGISIAKTLLGNKRYERVRGLILRFTSASR